MSEKIALVTGASRGLGFAVARELGANGWHVVALARTVGGLEDLADVIEASGGSTTLVPLDITDDAGLARMARAIHDRWGHLDLLVHCAAHAEPLSPAGHVSDKELDRCLAVNARATQRLIVMCDPLLKASDDGQAVLVTDTECAGKPFYSAYGTSKVAAKSFWDSWAAESQQLGPKVRYFAAKAMPTALRARFHPGEDRNTLEPCVNEASRLMAQINGDLENT